MKKQANFELQNHEGPLISIRKLVAADITLHGSRFILIEFGIGTPAMILFGLWLTLIGKDFVFFLGLYIFLVGINYTALLVYAIAIARKGSAKSEVGDDLAHNEQYLRKYGSQQFLILVPFTILVIAIVQEVKG